MIEKKPSEIACETLAQLTIRKLLPTPTNYQLIYSEVAGFPIEPSFFEQTARMIEYALPALGRDDVRFTEQTQTLLKAMREPTVDVTAVKLMLSNFEQSLLFAAEDQAEIKATLLRLLHLIIENIGELSIEDTWLKGQIAALMVASSPPLSLRRLDDVESRLKDVIFKQTEAKSKELKAHREMRQMLASFIERLSQMTKSTSVYHNKMEENARLIEQAKTIADIAPVLKAVIATTRSIANDSLAAHDDLRGMREKALETEAELTKLHQELDRLSLQTRHDPLTGALNRKGLDEALNREVSNVRRRNVVLSIVMLDIDDFKALNDRLGHASGDAALAHLATVAQAAMRPQDTLARYGGEEFVILLPDTPLDKGIEAMTRLQRELAKNFFLEGTEKIQITFSAGVAQLGPDELGAHAIHRADQAMYLAKRTGKNRVCGS
jgi:diguanylate cyclase